MSASVLTPPAAVPDVRSVAGTAMRADPARLERLAAFFETSARALADVGWRLEASTAVLQSGMRWSGPASRAYALESVAQQGWLSNAAEAFDVAAAACRAHAAAVEHLQADLRAAAQAAAELAERRARLVDAIAQVDRVIASARPGPSGALRLFEAFGEQQGRIQVLQREADAFDRDVAALRRNLLRVEDGSREADAQAAAALRQVASTTQAGRSAAFAAGAGHARPAAHEGGSLGSRLGGFLGGLGHSLADPLATLGGLVGLHGGLKDSWSHLVTGVGQAFTQPVQLLEALADIEDARAGNWGRWLGTVVPTVGLTGVTDGGFLVAKAPELVTELELQQARVAAASRLIEEAEQERLMDAALQGQRSSRTVPGTLSAHERLGGHTLSVHVGRSAAQLLARTVREGRPLASSFLDRPVAEEALAEVLERRAVKIEKWIASTLPPADPLLAPTKVVSAKLGHDVCLVVHATGELVTAARVLMVLKREDTPLGFRILSAYCEP